MIFISALLHSNLLKEFPVASNVFFIIIFKFEGKSSPWLDNGCFYISASLSSSEVVEGVGGAVQVSVGLWRTGSCH